MLPSSSVTVRPLIAVVLALSFAMTSSAADVAVHLINAKTASPIPNKPVALILYYGSKYKEPFIVFKGKTGPEGTAVFHLPEPPPARLRARIGMGGYWEQCTPNDKASYDTGEVLEHGVSEIGVCSKKALGVNKKFKPQPGDLYLFAEHLNLWERLTRCGEWGCRGVPPEK